MADKALNIIQRSASVEAAKDMIMNELAMRDALSGGHHNTRVERPMANDRELILNTLTSRMGGAASGPTLGRASLIDLAERALTAGGQRIAPGEHRDTIFQRAFGAGTTSDFPQLLNTAAARVLAQAMEDQQSPIKAIARKALARKTGARGLRSILEQALIDTMFELPNAANVEKVVVDESTIEENKPPLLVYREAAKKA